MGTNLLTLGLIAIISTSCSKAYNDPEMVIIGEWKLIEGETVFKEHRSFDYSDNKIIYYFHSDGVLTVTSDIEGHLGHASGQYTYNFSQSQLYENIDERFTLTIGSTSSPCSISAERMVLNDAPVDGPILHFVKQQSEASSNR